MHLSQPPTKSLSSQIFSYFFMGLGAYLAAFAIEVFLIPNRLIDGGIVGVAMIFGRLFSQSLVAPFMILFNIPFVILALRSIGKVFVAHMVYSMLVFAASLLFFQHVLHLSFTGESLEVVVIGGCILGIGIGLIIRYGGCLDGTEILGIIINKRTGITVGQVVLFCNIFIFAAAGLVYQDWHPPILSMITYMVVIKVMDAVIVGLDETKSMLIVSKKSRAIADSIIHDLGLGLTVFYGRGGFSGEDQEVLYVIAERLQLSELKELIHREDPSAFIAIENLHEVSYGKHGLSNQRGLTRAERIMAQIMKPNEAHES